MNTYKITFTDNSTTSFTGNEFRVKDGMLEIATEDPGRFSHYFPIANIFEWSVKRG